MVATNNRYSSASAKASSLYGGEKTASVNTTLEKSIAEDTENVYTDLQQSDQAEAVAKARRRMVKSKIF